MALHEVRGLLEVLGKAEVNLLVIAQKCDELSRRIVTNMQKIDDKGQSGLMNRDVVSSRDEAYLYFTAKAELQTIIDVCKAKLREKINKPQR